MKAELIEKIVAIEWDMFHNTQNVGGQASCQRDESGFQIMRSSQFVNWDKESLGLYLEDLRRAVENGDNLVTLKYAYMMRSTDPAMYSSIAHRLPEISEEKSGLVEALVAQTMLWCDEFAESYPNVCAAGRSLRSSSDSVFNTSVETYSRGEFSSYSCETLRALLRHYERMAAQGMNLHEKVAESEMLMMGLESLAAAEKALSRR